MTTIREISKLVAAVEDINQTYITDEANARSSAAAGITSLETDIISLEDNQQNLSDLVRAAVLSLDVAGVAAKKLQIDLNKVELANKRVKLAKINLELEETIDGFRRARYCALNALEREIEARIELNKQLQEDFYENRLLKIGVIGVDVRAATEALHTAELAAAEAVQIAITSHI